MVRRGGRRGAECGGPCGRRSGKRGVRHADGHQRARAGLAPGAQPRRKQRRVLGRRPGRRPELGRQSVPGAHADLVEHAALRAHVVVASGFAHLAGRVEHRVAPLGEQLPGERPQRGGLARLPGRVDHEVAALVDDAASVREDVLTPGGYVRGRNWGRRWIGAHLSSEEHAHLQVSRYSRGVDRGGGT
jgi:hypothetical protein